MPHRRDQIEGLAVRASCWNLVIEIPIARATVWPRRCDVPYIRTSDCELFKGQADRASDVARQLECPPETARRHLRQLTELGLLEREKNTYRPSQNVGPILGLNETTRAVRQAAVALGLCKR